MGRFYQLHEKELSKVTVCSIESVKLSAAVVGYRFTKDPGSRYSRQYEKCHKSQAWGNYATCHMSTIG